MLAGLSVPFMAVGFVVGLVRRLGEDARKRFPFLHSAGAEPSIGLCCYPESFGHDGADLGHADRFFQAAINSELPGLLVGA